MSGFDAAELALQQQLEARVELGKARGELASTTDRIAEIRSGDTGARVSDGELSRAIFLRRTLLKRVETLEQKVASYETMRRHALDLVRITHGR